MHSLASFVQLPHICTSQPMFATIRVDASQGPDSQTAEPLSPAANPSPQKPVQPQAKSPPTPVPAQAKTPATPVQADTRAGPGPSREPADTHPGPSQESSNTFAGNRAANQPAEASPAHAISSRHTEQSNKQPKHPWNQHRGFAAAGKDQGAGATACSKSGTPRKKCRAKPRKTESDPKANRALHLLQPEKQHQHQLPTPTRQTMRIRRKKMNRAGKARSW